MEGISSNLQMSGRVITPGQASDLSAYRCELSGLLAATTVINAFARFHKISTIATIHCDCISGLEKAFGVKPITLQDPSHDLLKAIRHELIHPPIQWN
jgi:hypothetical protein